MTVADLLNQHPSLAPDRHFNKVNVTPMYDRLETLARTQTKPRECYNNVFNMLPFNYEGREVRYVVGYAVRACLGIAIDHAWLRIGDTYYDPTWQIHNEGGIEDCTYYVVAELDFADFMEVIRENESCPPCAFDIQSRFKSYIRPLNDRS